MCEEGYLGCFGVRMNFFRTYVLFFVSMGRRNTASLLDYQPAWTPGDEQYNYHWRPCVCQGDAYRYLCVEFLMDLGGSLRTSQQ